MEHNAESMDAADLGFGCMDIQLLFASSDHRETLPCYLCKQLTTAMACNPWHRRRRYHTARNRLPNRNTRSISIVMMMHVASRRWITGLYYLMVCIIRSH